MSNTIGKFYSVIELAAVLGCSTKTVRRMIDRGDIHHHRFGRSIRVSQTDLDHFTRKCRAPEQRKL
jgi:excisionase family DNA binding protein